MDQLSWPSVNHVNDDAIDDETALGSGAAGPVIVIAWAVVTTVTPIDQTVCNDGFVIAVVAATVIMAPVGV